jgi:DNA-binding beta-propeller fold protein YncE
MPLALIEGEKAMKRNNLYLFPAVALLALLITPRVFGDEGDKKHSPLIPQLTPSPTFSDSTVPSNGDVNPYGVAFVPQRFPHGGPLRPNDIIVSNFNNSGNLQGTGTTIVRVNNGNPPTVFFQGQQGLGLTTALGILSPGFVLVGNLPSLDGTGMCVAESGPKQNIGQGGLLVIDKHGNLVKTFASATLLNGPWDLTLSEDGRHTRVFVANALSGTVTRLDLRVTENSENDGDKQDEKETDRDVVLEKATQIASGYGHRCDPAAFVVGPTGVALDEEKDILYVSSTVDNAIFAISNASDRTSDAGLGHVVVQDQAHLHGPLGLVLAANGDLISTQSDAINPDLKQLSEIVEFTPAGKFVAEFQVDPNAGSAFGLALRSHGDGFVFAAVDDTTAVLDIWVVP